jgi:hypothetical protein
MEKIQQLDWSSALNLPTVGGSTPTTTGLACATVVKEHTSMLAKRKHARLI